MGQETSAQLSLFPPEEMWEQLEFLLAPPGMLRPGRADLDSRNGAAGRSAGTQGLCRSAGLLHGLLCLLGHISILLEGSLIWSRDLHAATMVTCQVSQQPARLARPTRRTDSETEQDPAGEVWLWAPRALPRAVAQSEDPVTHEAATVSRDPRRPLLRGQGASWEQNTEQPRGFS